MQIDDLKGWQLVRARRASFGGIWSISEENKLCEVDRQLGKRIRILKKVIVINEHSSKVRSKQKGRKKRQRMSRN
jgi:hypothetical protein